jgi:hypothetical protein
MAGRGQPKTGGRQRGTRNKRYAELQALADEAVRENKTPLQHVLQVMNDPRESKERQLAAAALALPYCHPRYSSIEARVQVDSKVEISLKELAERAEREIEEAFREWEPPKTIEHCRSADAPASLPPAPTVPEEPDVVRDFALESAPAEDGARVRRLDRYRRPRPVGSWSG